MHIFLTIFGTIIAGTFTLALGQMVLRGVVEPAVELKRLIGLIDFLANFQNFVVAEFFVG